MLGNEWMVFGTDYVKSSTKEEIKRRHYRNIPTKIGSKKLLHSPIAQKGKAGMGGKLRRSWASGSLYSSQTTPQAYTLLITLYYFI